MSTRHVLAALFSVTALAAVGCAADPSEEPAEGATESAETASRPIAVSGAEAIRLRKTLLDAGATGEPLAALSLECTSRVCSFTPGKAGATPIRRVDPIGKAQALFDALSAVRYPNGMYGADGHAGTWTAAAASIDCSSKPGTCRVVHYFGDTSADVTGYVASTIKSALAQWGVASAKNVTCDAHPNPLSPSEPLANVTTYDCSLDGKPDVADPAPIAGALFEALKSAGAPVKAGYGGSHGSTEASIAVQSVSCRGASSCTIVPPDCRTSGCATGSSCMFCAARYQCLPVTARCN